MKIKVHTIINGCIALLLAAFIVFSLVSGLAYSITLSSVDTTDYTLSIYDRKVFGTRTALKDNYEAYVDEQVAALNEEGERFIVVKIKGEDETIVKGGYVLVFDAKMSDSKVVEIYKAQTAVFFGSSMPVKAAYTVINLIIFGVSGLIIFALALTEIILYFVAKSKALLKWVLEDMDKTDAACKSDSAAADADKSDSAE